MAAGSRAGVLGALLVIGQLFVRHERAALDVLNRRQRRERRLKRSSVCSVTSCWFGTPGTFARTLRICFRVFSGHIAYVPSAMTRRPVSAFFGASWAGDF